MCGKVIQPPWLKKLLEFSFYTNCNVEGHPQTKMICLTCLSEPICEVCSKDHHGDHKTLRVFKASHEVAVRVEHIKKLTSDYGTIQPYTFNNCQILFLHSKGLKSISPQLPKCDMCQVRLKSPNYTYCSVACKAGFQVENEANPSTPTASENTSEHSSDDKDNNEEVDSNQRRKRRKGTPLRSPLK